jgi:nucleotide-binding universal stress UspA family protein
VSAPPFPQIVVGVARADSARDAARQAMGLAVTLGGHVHLVTAFEPGSGNDDVERRHAESFLESMAASSSADVSCHAIAGDAAAALLRVAEEVDADLVVVGNKGMRGAKRVLGSIPNSVAHRAPCSVLILDTD